MSDVARPRFLIHRFDTPANAGRNEPDTHYRAFWRIEGRTYRVHVYSKAEWEQLTHRDHPAGARRLGKGWMVLQPLKKR